MESNQTSFLKVFVFVLVCVGLARAEEVECPEVENPFNLQIKPTKEILWNGETESAPMVISHINPKHQACDANYNDGLADRLRTSCDLGFWDESIRCRVHEKCYKDRVEILKGLVEKGLHNLETVMRMKAIKLFNKYGALKKVIFGEKPLSEYRVKDIVEKITSGPTDLFKGFSISEDIPKPSRDEFRGEFENVINIYEKLRGFQKPKTWKNKIGLKKECTISLDDSVTKEEAKAKCAAHLFADLKNANKLEKKGKKMIGILNEAFELVVDYISDGQKKFPGVKIPFRSDCLNKDDKSKDSSITDSSEYSTYHSDFSNTPRSSESSSPSSYEASDNSIPTSSEKDTETPGATTGYGYYY